MVTLTASSICRCVAIARFTLVVQGSGTIREQLICIVFRQRNAETHLLLLLIVAIGLVAHACIVARTDQ
ncbi:hypothetical protein C488_14512 [Natrinema pellirubrum DSM 15624]|uniref:Uncharacterized protein n=1 Tax=Natrinema pellirubrum (strain DSM 15624 / CIP 106293 / JCM 10476 / NCIMB 786 / 157) TaxID=797303 RepID=L9YGT2_NATP1|nr:hypothetical protein C488_14512 [Natrinema pellirubrum DSM 15624]